ncbi:hypothetical protein ACO2Q3_20580 [Caulobacter sp. KR2-114]|uniref:hypothetical protein n=1 Tax=Caulobacter sp. KR2-114 TaxID=3400912 RepID=UPI003C10363E
MHVHDDRQEEPLVFFVDVANLARARELALSRLEQSPHHRRVLLLDGETVLASIERDLAG